MGDMRGLKHRRKSARRQRERRRPLQAEGRNLGRNQTYGHFDLRLLASRTMRKLISVLEAPPLPPVCANYSIRDISFHPHHYSDFFPYFAEKNRGSEKSVKFSPILTGSEWQSQDFVSGLCIALFAI